MATTTPDAKAKRSSHGGHRHLGKNPPRQGNTQRQSSGMRSGPALAARKGAVTPINNKHKRAEATQDGERYVVVITNVENDFAKVHQEAVPRYCCLNEQHFHGLQQRPSSSTVKNADGVTSSPLGKGQKRRQCRYTVSARTETRSVEVAVYGKADGDVASVYLPSRSGMRESKHSYQTKEEEKAVTPMTLEGEEEGDGGTLVECVNPPLGNETVFASLEDMVMALRHAPYFTHPPKFLLTVAGKKEGEVLRQVKSRKRQRDDTAYEKKEQKQQHGDPSSGDANDSHTLLQSTVRQADMVTAVATTSARMHTKELRHQLKDIPGFVTCWMLYPQHFRVVFASKMTLFRAKELLDQFEVDGHVRVSLTLSDAVAKEFADHLATVENTA
ncbi:hypothetical protein TraAM80_05108 [Trypanosoma rangeli]|uniref:Uncharacterized protein n=1 Tax=Trypanosoma rangeli TaxID=5698 RepID=A0A422NGE2_TRYRA|nr:uncharacterized protein TraAM80_05108 [Trypanosoma rangeli]RNF04516.1 hypothetical protein TraAM80_05108 [Trypanosoma rangeli]|eukprot:RNF04516.1 hypothetical protein TraAM80_05108 [Trypanosoma rangeli]